MAHVKQNVSAKMKISTTTTQRAGPVVCTLFDAYSAPMMSIEKERTNPPKMMELRRPILSEYITAGMEMASMRIAETPLARKEEDWAGMPAWAKRVGAY
jgi:hypothetical protein